MKKQIENLCDAYEFYQKCMNDPRSAATGAYNNAVDDVFKAVAELLEKESYMFDLYEAKLFGYCFSGNSLDGLIVAMGMSADEWMELKGKYDLPYLSETEIREIEEQLGVPK